MSGTPFDSALLPASATDVLMCAIRDALKAHPWVREQFGDRVFVAQVPAQDPLDIEYRASAIIIAEESWLPEGWSAAATYPTVVLTVSAQWPSAIAGYLENSGETATANAWIALLFGILSTDSGIQAKRGGIPPKLIGNQTTRRPAQVGEMIATTARVLTGNPRTPLG